MTKIDLNSVWDDAKEMGRTNKDLLSAIAGMFVLLPGVIADQLETPMGTLSPGESSARMSELMMQYFAANWHLLLVHGVITSFGALAMFALLLRPERLTVGESLRAALVVLPSYFIASLLQSFAVTLGLFLFVLPGLYLLARLVLIAPVAAAESRANPVELLQRSFALTSGNGWRILALLAVLFVVAMIVSFIVNMLFGILASLLLPPEMAELLLSIVGSLIAAALGVLIVLISAALYRGATMPDPMPWSPRS